MSGTNGTLPGGWVNATLGDLGEYHNGRAFKKHEWAESGRPIIRIQNLTDSSKPYNYFQGEAEPRHEVEAGDLLVSWAATLDVFRWTGPSAVLNQHIFKVESDIDPDFHYYVLKYALDALYAQTHGAGMVHITRGRFDTTPVVLPPLDEQRRIVGQLERQFSLVRAGEADIDSARRGLRTFREAVLTAAVSGRLVPNEAEESSADEMLQGILGARQARWLAEDMGRHKAPTEPQALDIELPHGWTVATIDQLAVGVQYGSSQKTDADPSGVPVLRMGNIVDGELKLRDLKYLPQAHAEFPSLLLVDGDLLFNRTNSPELVGKTAVARDLPDKWSFASYIIRVRFADEVIPEFVSYFVNSPYGRRWVRENVSQQVGQANVNGAKLRALTVPLPPRATQQRIVEEVERLFATAGRLAGTLTTALHDADAVERSLLHHALTGQHSLPYAGNESGAELLERIRSQKAERHTRSRKTTVRF